MLHTYRYTWKNLKCFIFMYVNFEIGFEIPLNERFQYFKILS